MLGRREAAILRKGTREDGRPLTVEEREKLLERFLPAPASSTSPSPSPKPAASRRTRQTKKSRRKPMRAFLKKQVHMFVYTLIHFFFSVYIRFRKAFHAVVDRIMAVLYYHHRTPEYIQKDLRNLKKLPQHLSVILDLRDDEHGGAGLEGLINDVGELAAWCACAGIPFLSVYERTGVLKSCIPQTYHSVSQNLESYLGPHRKPTLSVRAPNQQTYSPPNTPPSAEDDNPSRAGPSPTPSHLTILLISVDDGRSTLVDLTKTLADMAQRQKLSPSDISPELIDVEIVDSVMNEPDLLVLFGPRVELKGYPPWQVRLTEIL